MVRPSSKRSPTGWPATAPRTTRVGTGQEGELKQWEARNPIERLRRLLTTEQWADETYLAALAAESDDLAAETRRACLALAQPRLEDTFRHTLVEETALLRAEREAFVAYKESFV